MKIGILTQQLLNNYGGLLQNYALQQVLISLGHEPITIDHKPRQYPFWYVCLSRIKEFVLSTLFCHKNKKQKYSLTKEEEEIIETETKYFIEKSIIHTRKCVGGDDFRTETKERGLEVLVVGSDQCWRPLYNEYIEEMFLRFAESLPLKKRIAYAASFGTDDWEFPTELTKKCSELAEHFDLVTVREDSGVDLCSKFLGVEAKHVLDPTMLLTKENYISLIEQYGIKESDGNLFYYILDPTQGKNDFVERVSNKLNLKSFHVLPTYNEDHRTKTQVKHEIEKCVYPSPVKWLRAFMDSKMTIVDSFHGMVFSIIFNKPFWVIGNQERGLSRFNSLLKTLGLEDRLICEKDFENLDFLKPIDWAKVNNLLQEQRNTSIHYLKVALE